MYLSSDISLSWRQHWFICLCFRKVNEIEAREEDEEKIPVDLNKSWSWPGFMVYGLNSKISKRSVKHMCIHIWILSSFMKYSSAKEPSWSIAQRLQLEYHLRWEKLNLRILLFCIAMGPQCGHHIEGGNHRFLINIMMESMQNNFLFVIFMWKVYFSEFYFCELKLKLMQELRKLPNPMSL